MKDEILDCENEDCNYCPYGEPCRNDDIGDSDEKA
ncbi:hypothetical protein LCGC14_0475440 [marine sediment metagenome]|uniref:Uncharacterized protein n=1 Tax=marine sediment metagenome TaxID=412755 RepID=A0A0F9UXV1_9ZZZZ